MDTTNPDRTPPRSLKLQAVLEVLPQFTPEECMDVFREMTRLRVQEEEKEAAKDSARVAAGVQAILNAHPEYEGVEILWACGTYDGYSICISGGLFIGVSEHGVRVTSFSTYVGRQDIPADIPRCPINGLVVYTAHASGALQFSAEKSMFNLDPLDPDYGPFPGACALAHLLWKEGQHMIPDAPEITPQAAVAQELFGGGGPLVAIRRQE